MSRSKHDQRGGHPPKQRTKRRTCGCCDDLDPAERDPNRTRRENAAERAENRANGDWAQDRLEDLYAHLTRRLD